MELLFGVGGLAAGLGYAYAQFIRGKNNAAKDLNETLNELLEVRDKRVKDLESIVREQGKQIEYLTVQIATLTTKKGDLEEIIAKALSTFFEHNPRLALQVNQEIKK
jgi:hypothetical protein